MASTSNQGSNGRKKGRSGAAVAGTVFATVGKVIGTLLLVMVITGAILACFGAVYIQKVIMPEAHLDGNFDMDMTSTIYYKDKATGEYVEHLSLHGTENRILVSYDEIPQNLVNATIAIEDQRFLKHNGVDWKRTAYGVFAMFTGRDIQGGSTITQQLIKNFTQYDDVTVKRKIMEIFRALEFDSTYSKEQIMEWYLNYIYLGAGCNGVATAARTYFDKDLSELSLAECASLISITNNPSLYSPYSNLRVTDPKTGEVKTARDYNKYRQELVLNAMCEQGMISQTERDAAKAEELVFARGEDEARPTVIYNWYDEQVIDDVVRDLMATFGYSESLAKNMVNSGGLKIYACVDTEIQDTVEEIYLNRENLELTSASGQKAQSAVVVMDPEGNVVALAGAMEEKKGNLVLNRASGSRRQPGSSIKPLSVYAPALELGVISPVSAFDDYPVQELSGNAWPQNSYLSYDGLMSVSQAIEKSSNPVAVRVIEAVTPEASFQFMTERFHIKLEEGRVIRGDVKSDKDRSPLALGGLTDGTTVMEMAAAYATFPRDGMYIAPRTYYQVLDSEDKVLLDNTKNEPEPILKSSTAWYINTLLKNVITGTNGATGTEARLSGMTVAGKTGSTNSNNDRWFVGYTPYYTAAVWVGYDQPERIKTTGNPAARLWKKVMAPIHEGLENKDFTKPEGLITVNYCRDSGLLATDACRADLRGSRVASSQMFAADAPSTYCEIHKAVEVCTASVGSGGGGYYLAGAFCPRTGDAEIIVGGAPLAPTVKTVSLLNLPRERIGGKSAKDDGYLLSNVEAAGVCPVHTAAPVPDPVLPPAYDPSLFDIADPATWPPLELYPNFDPANPATWPKQPEIDPPEGGNNPVEPTPSVTPHPEPTPTSPPGNNSLPPPVEEEPFVPVS